MCCATTYLPLALLLTSDEVYEMAYVTVGSEGPDQADPWHPHNVPFSNNKDSHMPVTCLRVKLESQNVWSFSARQLRHARISLLYHHQVLCTTVFMSSSTPHSGLSRCVLQLDAAYFLYLANQ